MSANSSAKSSEKGRRQDIVSLAEAHCNVDARGFGNIMEIYSPNYPGALPTSRNGYGDFKHNSVLAGKYNIRKFRANGRVEIVTMGRHQDSHDAGTSGELNKYGQKGNTLIAWQIYGFAPVVKQVKGGIPQPVRDALSGEPCVFALFSTREIEVDHKHGRVDQNDYPVGAALLDVENYQPATKEMNNIKRELCRKCKKDNKRFDARTADFTVGWVEGGERFEGTREGCRGCYLFDPVAFKQSLERGRRRAA